MKADLDGVDLKLLANFFIHCIHPVARLPATGDIGLIGDDDQNEARLPELRDRLRHARKILELLDAIRSARLAIPEESPVDHPIAIQEYSFVFLLRPGHKPAYTPVSDD